jgi:hypothetical protein
MASSAPPPPMSPDPPASIPLTVATADAFVSFAGASTSGQLGYIRNQIDSARGDSAITTALLDLLAASWRLENGQHVVPDHSRTLIIFEIVKGLRAVEAVDELHEMIWRPLPPQDPNADVQLSLHDILGELETAAAGALVCVPGAEAAALVQEVIASHPDQAVRVLTERQVTNQWCEFLQTALNP